jgi:homotetrameric cytidine deaminase
MVNPPAPPRDPDCGLHCRAEGFTLRIRESKQKSGVEMSIESPIVEPSENRRALIDAALAAAERSYSPYSGFRVGAALLLTCGEVVTGTNVENVSYGLTICAERSALVRAVAEFGPQIRVAAVAVVNLNDAPSPPCGACRQVLAEFMDGDDPVSFPASFPAGATGAVETVTLPIRELLPHGFDLRLK